MRIKNLLSACALVAIATMSQTVNAVNIDANTAQAKACSFIRQHAASRPGSLKAPAMSDLKLAYSEPSKADATATAYYAFNITGGGFVIVAGDDRASQVLGYSDQGCLDFNNLPDNFKALMRGYKEEIEYLQAHPEINVTPALRASSGTGIEPLIKSNWGQEEPYDWQCPVYNGEYCVVGCVATAMAQVMYYWRYPTSSPELNSYYCYDIGQTVPALPGTTFDYSKMLRSYCHWDWDQSKLIQDTYTDEQAQAVAKISRYCGQAVRMGYSPEGSGAYTSDQLSAMKTFGYSSSARDVIRDSWWGSNYYTTAEWEAMIKEELDKRQPILYSASDPAAGGHAFICDGYNAEGLFHFNFGWYGTCDGWYVSTALNMTHRDGDALRFNSNHEMLLGVVPPSYCVISADALSMPGGLLILGEDVNIEASNVNILSSSDKTNLMFTINNTAGRRMATSTAVNVTVADFVQGSTVSSALTLPEALEAGSYSLQFHHYLGVSARMSTRIDCESGNINVVGHMAKYNAAFTIDDVATVIDYLLEGSHPTLTIDDVALLIDTLLGN